MGVFFALAACGDDNDGQTDLEEACADYCSALDACFPNEQPQCGEECLADLGTTIECQTAWAAWYACVASAACEEIRVDACIEKFNDVVNACFNPGDP